MIIPFSLTANSHLKEDIKRVINEYIQNDRKKFWKKKKKLTIKKFSCIDFILVMDKIHFPKGKYKKKNKKTNFKRFFFKY